MSARSSLRSLRALPAMIKVGVLGSLAYPSEALLWILTSVMPLVSLALFDAAMRDGPFGRFRTPQITAYFLSTFIVRQLTSAFVSWQINADIRDGALAVRLVRPVHPLLTYAAESAAALPLRATVALPMAFVLLLAVGARELTRDPVVWLAWVASVAGAWALSHAVSFFVGGLAFFIDSSAKVMDAYLALYFVFSGYLVPVELFPARLRAALEFLPFRYQIGLPVELMTGAHGRADAVLLVAQQWLFVFFGALAVRALWRRGLARYSAFGG